MSSHELRLVYDGLEATHHKMPTSFEKQVIAGAQEFLGSHAFFFTEGTIPTNVNDHSKHFRLHGIRQRDACWEAIFGIDLNFIAPEIVQEYVSHLAKGFAKDAADLTRLAFYALIYESFKTWKNRRPLSNPVFDRIEPVFSGQSGNQAPMFDQTNEAEMQRRKLYGRVGTSMVKITAPLGRAALHVDIWFDDQKLDHMERRIVTIEEAIAEALTPIRRERGYPQPQHH